MKSVRQILRDFNIRPLKRLGQSFLVDVSVMEKIVAIADIKPDETIVEIGSGLGLMTGLMAGKAAHVAAVEIDGKLIPILKKHLEGYRNVEVIQGDILEYDFRSAKGENQDRKIKVVGNIPYSISSPILFHILEQRKDISAAVLMMQKEVVDRLCAGPGTKVYGIPSVLFGLYTRISREFSVAPDCFHPKPEVVSSVVKILISEEPLCPVRDEALFTRLVRAAFSHRRKTLFNNLKSQVWEGYDDKGIQNLLNNLGIGEMKRAEELSIQQYAAICNALTDS